MTELDRPVPEWRRGSVPCQVCRHPRRAELDWELATDARPLVEIAGLYEVGYEAVKRHRRQHLTKSILAAAEAEAERKGEVYRTVLQQLRDRKDQLDKQLRAAILNKDPLSYVRLMKLELDRLAFEAKLTGELTAKVDVNVTVGERVDTTIADLLAQFPNLAEETKREHASD
jgi:hypothetical protein